MRASANHLSTSWRRAWLRESRTDSSWPKACWERLWDAWRTE